MSYAERCNVVIVDGYSAGRDLARELHEMGATLYHLRSTQEPPPLFKAGIDASPYKADFGYLGPAEHVAKVLAALRVDHVVAGCELGVSYAETLAHLVGTPTNLFAQIPARRNKYHMIEALHERGLFAAKQALVKTESEAVQWSELHGRWPVVIKALDSAGSNNVTICRSFEDVRRACRRSFGARTLFGDVNRALLAQSWLDGVEYMVNTVSRDGRHFMTDAWRIGLRLLPGYAVVLEDFAMLDPNSAVASGLLDYTFRALDALGFVNGAAHSELMWTAQGPALVETGARLMGGSLERASYSAAGFKTQSEYFALDLVQPDVMNAVRARSDRYAAGRNLMEVWFSFDGDGVIRDVSGLKRLRELPSFQAMYRDLPVGSEVRLTTETTGHGGAIYLVHDDADQVRRDREQIRQWDDEGLLYGIEYESADEPVTEDEK
jgi:hypothetical protein